MTTPEWAKRLEREVIERDEEACVNCGRFYMDAHHIIPRGRKKPYSKETWRIENMCCLCRSCHDDGQTSWMREKLLRKMVELYDYDMAWAKEFGIAWEGENESRT